MHKHHGILYGIVIILVALQIFTFISFSSKITSLSSDIKQSELALNESFSTALSDYKRQTQTNFQEVSTAIAKQEEAQTAALTEINILKSTSGDFSSIIDSTVRSVVTVLTDKSAGTGFFVAPNGYILTNQHVIADAGRISIITYDRKEISAQLIGQDVKYDLALLKIEKDYPFLDLADSSTLQVGRKVIAIGNPLGLSFTVTEGIISALDRTGPNGLNDYIQTDVSLNPGNSGGPLIDTSGDAVGMNNFKASNAENIGFALESDVIEQKLKSLANNKTIL